ncbi:MAG: 50S ribosomal protein L11 methyltransferase [Ignavibacterium sp.]
MIKLFRKFIIQTHPFPTDILSGYIWQLEPLGIEEEDEQIIVYTNSETNLQKENLTKLLSDLIDAKLIDKFSIEEEILQDKNWNEEWEKNLKIIKVSDRIIIKPSFKEYEPKSNEIVITIDPKMSFGTGEHATTKLSLQALEKYVKLNYKVLDVGTGTGILAIAAIKLGASYALGIDNDEWSIENSIENIKRNNVEDKIEIELNEISNINKNEFDLIVANIQKNILMEIAKEIKKKCKENGFIILSGLLKDDQKDIQDKYEKIGFKFIEQKSLEEWLVIVFQNITT